MNTNLRPGDIIVFIAEDDWLSRAIAKLTKSDVSHAAMVYTENSIVESVASGIGINNIEIQNGKNAYVMRFSEEVDTAALIAAADKYLNAKIHYDFPGLFMLAGLLIFKNILPTGKIISAVNRILAVACLKLDEYIQYTLLHHNERAMVCSQLVYQIYADCAEQYHIKFSESIFSNDDLAGTEAGSICLADIAGQQSPENLDTMEPKADILVNDALFKDLYFALVESTETDFISNENIKPTLALVTRFLDSAGHLAKITGSNIPLDAMFIAPCDFVYHAENLMKMGTIEIERIFVS